MSSSKQQVPTQSNRGGLGVGPTSKGLHGGPSRRTGGGQGFATTTKQRGTRGGTTSNAKTDFEIEYTMFNGERVVIKPKPLMKTHQATKPDAQGGTATAISNTGQGGKDAGQVSVPKPSGADATATQNKDQSMSMQSQLTSSLLETSEDEEAKKKAEEKLAKKTKKGLTEKEIEAQIDIDLCESETITAYQFIYLFIMWETFDLMFIPSSLVQNDTDDHTIVTSENKKYQDLINNKIGSDSYTERGSQTLNLSHKPKEIHYKGFQQENKDLQATNWDIDDASKQQRVSEAKKQQIDYNSQIDDIMIEKLKNPNCLIDAEALASHISIVYLFYNKRFTQFTTKSGQNKPNQSGTTSSNSNKNKANMSQSQSQLKESTNKSI